MENFKSKDSTLSFEEALYRREELPDSGSLNHKKEESKKKMGRYYGKRKPPISSKWALLYPEPTRARKK